MLFAVPFSLHAQTASKSDTTKLMKEVVVTYQADRLTPITFQNLSGKQLKAKNVGQEPSSLLLETPSITAYADAGNTQGYSYFRLRGIDQARINISLDGVPLNEPEDQGAYFSNYPDLMNSVSKVQIQRGIGTSKNGRQVMEVVYSYFRPILTILLIQQSDLLMALSIAIGHLASLTVG